jgi:hypothetical protein
MSRQARSPPRRLAQAGWQERINAANASLGCLVADIRLCHKPPGHRWGAGQKLYTLRSRQCWKSTGLLSGSSAKIGGSIKALAHHDRSGTTG